MVCVKIPYFAKDLNSMLDTAYFSKLFCLIGIVSIIGCSTSKKVLIEEIYVDNIQEDVICFLVMNISRAITDNKSILELIQTTRANGKIKPQPILPENPNKLIFTIMGDSSVLTMQYLDHPLFKKMEHSHEKNGLSTQMVTLTQEEFYMRLPLNPDSRYLIISESVNGGEAIELITFKI